MTPVIFDPEARAEFLSSVKYYEGCQPIPYQTLISGIIHRYIEGDLISKDG